MTVADWTSFHMSIPPFPPLWSPWSLWSLIVALFLVSLVWQSDRGLPPSLDGQALTDE